MLDAMSIINARTNNKLDKMEKTRIAFRDVVGFNENDETYVPIRITEEIVLQLKEAGCEYNRHIGFHSPQPIVGVKMAAVSFAEVCDYDTTYGKWRFTDYKCKSVIGRICKTDLTDAEANSRFVGSVGDRICIDVKFEGGVVIPSRSDYGDFCKLKFVTTNGNRIVWFQRTYGEGTVKSFVERYGDNGKVQLIGSIKEHKSTRGVMETGVRNCLISGKNGMSLALYHKCILENAHAA